jgi:hypothetical protein
VPIRRGAGRSLRRTRSAAPWHHRHGDCALLPEPVGRPGGGHPTTCWWHCLSRRPAHSAELGGPSGAPSERDAGRHAGCADLRLRRCASRRACTRTRRRNPAGVGRRSRRTFDGRWCRGPRRALRGCRDCGRARRRARALCGGSGRRLSRRGRGDRRRSRGRAERRRRPRGGRRSRAPRQQPLGIDVPLLLRRDTDAKVHVRFRHLWLSAWPDRSDRLAFVDGVAPRNCHFPEMDERHRVAVRSLNRHDFAVPGRRSCERDRSVRRRAHARAGLAGNVDAAVLAARVRIVSERKVTQDGAVGRPCPGTRVGRYEERKHESREQESAHA